MPYLTLRVAGPESTELSGQLAEILLKHTTTILRKDAESTGIVIEFLPTQHWFVGGKRVSDLQGTLFFLDVKVTEGTNTKGERERYIREVFADLEAVLGPLAGASYIVVHAVRGDCWGYQGQTQEHRYVQSQFQKFQESIFAA